MSIDQQAHDFKLIGTLEDIIEDYDNYSSDTHNICCKLKERLHKLHFYEWVFFNGRDSDEARRLKSCKNDERELIELNLNDCI